MSAAPPSRCSPSAAAHCAVRRHRTDSWLFPNGFYFARDDSRFLVPKKQKYMGWTVNMAYVPCWASGCQLRESYCGLGTVNPALTHLCLASLSLLPRSVWRIRHPAAPLAVVGTIVGVAGVCALKSKGKLPNFGDMFRGT